MDKVLATVTGNVNLPPSLYCDETVSKLLHPSICALPPDHCLQPSLISLSLKSLFARELSLAIESGPIARATDLFSLRVSSTTLAKQTMLLTVPPAFSLSLSVSKSFRDTMLLIAHGVSHLHWCTMTSKSVTSGAFHGLYDFLVVYSQQDHFTVAGSSILLSDLFLLFFCFFSPFLLSSTLFESIAGLFDKRFLCLLIHFLFYCSHMTMLVVSNFPFKDFYFH